MEQSLLGQWAYLFMLIDYFRHQVILGCLILDKKKKVMSPIRNNLAQGSIIRLFYSCWFAYFSSCNDLAISPHKIIITQRVPLPKK